MASVTSRVSKIKQPKGGYIKLQDFEEIRLNKQEELNENENIHGIIIGLAVDYLTRFLLNGDKREAFYISLMGANRAKKYIADSEIIAKRLLKKIKDLSDDSIISACKLVSFDVWKRSLIKALDAKRYSEINPDMNTIENIRIMVNRSLNFFEKYGPVVKYGFTFEGEKPEYNGYTISVNTGDGDYLTKDTLWDFKVTKKKPDKNDTLQVLMYWIMGQHSKKEMFMDIKKIGIFNPRQNVIYLMSISQISNEIINIIEKDVICYL